MAVAEITFDYDQVLALAKQLTLADRQRLSNELVAQSAQESWSEVIDRFPHVDISEEEILAECDIVREQYYRRYREAN